MSELICAGSTLETVLAGQSNLSTAPAGASTLEAAEAKADTKTLVGEGGLSSPLSARPALSAQLTGSAVITLTGGAAAFPTPLVGDVESTVLMGRATFKGAIEGVSEWIHGLYGESDLRCLYEFVEDIIGARASATGRLRRSRIGAVRVSRND